jgi:hypothetical protein
MAAHSDTLEALGPFFASISQLASYGVGQINIGLYNQITVAGASITAQVVLANTPQLVLSCAYLFYNDLFTRMLLTKEWLSYSTTRKSLRVSRPVAGSEQRSTYFLQLPYRYSLPMIIASIGLHWLVSQSIYSVFITAKDYSQGPEVVDLGYRMSGLQYSPLALILALALSGAMILVTLGFSIFRKYPETGMPLARSSTLAISSACHSAPGDEAAALQAVMWGAVEDKKRRGKFQVCFSSKEVSALTREGVA